jgi:CubicO group peptidase (beta-lactamase class C family)
MTASRSSSRRPFGVRLLRALAWCVGTLACLLVIAAFANPTLVKIIRLQRPGPQTYCAFEQRIVRRSMTPFTFHRAAVMRDDLDTLHVYDGGGHLIPFRAYAEQGRLTAFLVVRNDTLLYERYFRGYTDTTLSSLFSMSKSVTSLLAGRALADGALRGLDQRVADVIPELAGTPNYQTMTLRHLLSMRSGLAFSKRGGGFLADLFSDEAHFYYSHDLRHDLVAMHADTVPGARWVYTNAEPVVVAWMIERATGRSLAAYMEEKLWQPMGAEHDGSWSLDHENGLENAGSSYQATARDVARLGRLLLHRGTLGDREILPATWIDASTVIDTTVPPATAKGWQQVTQQFYWWIPQLPPRGDYLADGFLGQRLYVHPATRTIIVQFADGGAGDFPYRAIACHLAGRPFSYPARPR